jgi:hypothetical protein
VKTIVYLDQPFVSNLWKSTQGSYQGDQVWAELYEVLDRGVKKEGTIICPATRFHDEEGSLDSRLAEGIHKVSTELSWDLKFLTWNKLLDNQAYRALHRYLGIPLGKPEWSDAFNSDPHEPISERSVQFLGAELLIDAFIPRPHEFSAERRAAKENYVRELTSLVPASEQRTFAAQLKLEKFFFVKQRWFEPLQRIQENLKRGESASAVDKDRYESFRTLKTAYERFCPEEHKFGDFLTSEVLYEAPFIDVYCSIYAAMNVYLPNRKDKASDLDDVAILATVLPYCGVVTTDKEMKDICMRAGLHTKYQVEIFSPRLGDVRGLIARLTAR